MKTMFPIVVMLVATATDAQPPKRAYASCDLAAQHALKGEVGGKIKDAGQANILMRSNILHADIGSARKAGRVSQTQADRLWKQAEGIGEKVDAFVKKQGFLSAAERATYDRQLDAIALPICRS